MWRNMVTSLFVHERITTTDAKAKDLRRVAERLINKATRVSHLAAKNPARMSQNDRARLVAARRVMGRHVRRQAEGPGNEMVDVLYKLIEDLGPRFADRPGGYTRIIKLPTLRKGDNAAMSIIELVDAGEQAEASGKGSKSTGEKKGKGLVGRILGGRKSKKADDEEADEEE